MELGSADVRLAGDLANVVHRTNVTPAELAILRQIHGGNAVVNVKVTGKMDAEAVKTEGNRLVNMYGDEMFTDLFPGMKPNLPGSFEDVGLEVEVVTPDKPAGRKKKAAPKVEANPLD